jgi:hypothetical protein
MLPWNNVDALLKAKLLVIELLPHTGQLKNDGY